MVAFDGYLASPGDWQFVRENANGYYVNSFPLILDQSRSGLIPAVSDKLRQMASLFANKVAFYETDFLFDPSPGGDTPDGRRFNDKVRIDSLRMFFTEVTHAVVYNFLDHVDQAFSSRMGPDGLQWRYLRPVFGGMGPWDMGGDINSQGNSFSSSERAAIGYGSGSATDGPLGIWAKNYHQVHEASFSMVKYSHSLAKMAMVMMAPYDPWWDPSSTIYVPKEPIPDIATRSKLFLQRGQDCVRKHEAAGAAPDVWVISYYAAQLETFLVAQRKKTTVSQREQLLDLLIGSSIICSIQINGPERSLAICCEHD